MDELRGMFEICVWALSEAQYTPEEIAHYLNTSVQTVETVLKDNGDYSTVHEVYG